MQNTHIDQGMREAYHPNILSINLILQFDQLGQKTVHWNQVDEVAIKSMR